ncbi:MAG: acyl carrier protein [Sulfurimonas sp.]|jgi:acyl carrier protein|uniref:acyl carrier protein n=1 Tax=Sulfurimonas sp. TaxID=2022749 RepID=UPI0025F78185|nr:acyl carrier protein [Sulfurimonas sp.]
MTREDVYDKIVSVLVEEFEVEADDIKMEANLFTDLELDSLDAIDLMVTLDKELGIEIKTEEMKDIRTISDVCDFALAANEDE